MRQSEYGKKSRILTDTTEEMEIGNQRKQKSKMTQSGKTPDESKTVGKRLLAVECSEWFIKQVLTL